jgi:hypothetical protein
MSARRTALAIGAAAVLAIGIACSRPTLSLGDGCVINSDCMAPLVCELARCRRQCVDSRDCGAGLRCLVTPGSPNGGGCQLEHEVQCTLSSDCAASGLVCQNGTCTTMCTTDRDCARGAMCTVDTAGVQACHEPLSYPCLYDSMCPGNLVCGRDQLCHTECVCDRDCAYPRSCLAGLCWLVEAGPSSAPCNDDASVGDAGR